MPVECHDGYAWKHENYVTAVNERDQARAKILELEAAAAWVPVAQRLPDEGVNVIIRIEDGSGGPTYERMAHIRRHTSGAYDWMEPNRQYVWGGKVIEWFAIPGGTK